MPRLTLASVLFAMTGPVACVPAYRPPRSDEPHAVLKVRRAYEQVKGAHLREVVDVNERRAYSATTHAAAGRDPRTDALLIHAEPARMEVGGTYFHVENRTVQEQYTVQVPETHMESYDCSTGYGTSRSYRTCTRSATRYRTDHRTRWVTRAEEVPDGSCRGRAAFLPAVGRTYLLQYTYQDHGVCTLSCFEQIPAPGGGFRNAPCPPPPATTD